MDLTPTPTNATAGTIKDLDLEPDSPTRNQSFGKSFSFSNGVLKRHHHQGPLLPLTPPDGFTYRECLKNHAASLGRHALDGCGEFMPSPAANEADPTSIKCAACGCHRNFHRREPDDVPPSADPRSNQVIEYHPQHRHHPPPPPPPHSPDSASPPPISSSHYGGHQPTHHHYRHHLSTPPPHMLLTLSTAAPPESSHPPPPSSAVAMVSPISRKRFRTKFTQLQKECMFEFAERVGWKLQKQDEDIIREFCDEIGVERGVLKVWVHNNKSTLGKKPSWDHHGNNNISSQNNNATRTHMQVMMKNEPNREGHHHNHQDHHHFRTNGSSSSP